MRKLTLVALAVGMTAIVAACSSSGNSSSPSGGSGGGELTGKTWQLTAITEKVPAFQGVVPPADQANYTILFNADGTFNAKVDCNSVAGSYTTTSAGGLAIVPGPSTLMACPEPSMGSQYVTGLANAASYTVAGDQLTITLKDDGTLVFNAATAGVS